MTELDLSQLDFAESSADAINGVWVQLDDHSGMEFLVRPINDRLRAWTLFTIDCRGPAPTRKPEAPPGGTSDPKYAHYLEAVARYDAAVAEADVEFTRNMYRRLYAFLANDVVMDWRHVQLRDGTEIPYSPEMAHRLFREHPRLCQRVFDACRAVGGEDQVDFEDAAEKKANAPDGGSNGASSSKTSNASGAVVGAFRH